MILYNKLQHDRQQLPMHSGHCSPISPILRLRELQKKVRSFSCAVLVF